MRLLTKETISRVLFEIALPFYIYPELREGLAICKSKAVITFISQLF